MISEFWREAFQQAWLSYCNGSFPIGAVIIDDQNNIIAVGRNKVYEKRDQVGQISDNKMAHAEVNALLQINNLESNENRKKYKIFSTMEPCILCFGAIVVSGIREIHFAARDGVLGSTNLKDGNDYLRNKAIQIFGNYPELEIVQMVLKTDFVLRRGHKVQELLDTWRKDCPLGIAIGERWYENNTLQKAKEMNQNCSSIMDEIIHEIHVHK